MQRQSIKHEHEQACNCWDNAVAESFFSSLKSELIRRRNYSPGAQLKSEILKCIEFTTEESPAGKSGKASEAPSPIKCLIFKTAPNS